jgi:hypothetical protein
MDSFGRSIMWTTLSCVLFAVIGAGIAAYLSRGRHPAAIIVGLIVGAMFGLAPLTLAQHFLADFAKRPGLFDRIGLLIQALRDGDPVFWTATWVLLLFVLVILGVWAKTALEFKREEEWNRRRGRGRADAGRRQEVGGATGAAPIATSGSAWWLKWHGYAGYFGQASAWR